MSTGEGPFNDANTDSSSYKGKAHVYQNQKQLMSPART